MVHSLCLRALDILGKLVGYSQISPHTVTWLRYWPTMHCTLVKIHVWFVTVCIHLSVPRVAVSRSKDVPPFGPNIPAGAKFGKTQAFADFLLTKGREHSSLLHWQFKIFLVTKP